MHSHEAVRFNHFAMWLIISACAIARGDEVALNAIFKRFIMFSPYVEIAHREGLTPPGRARWYLFCL